MLCNHCDETLFKVLEHLSVWELGQVAIADGGIATREAWALLRRSFGGEKMRKRRRGTITPLEAFGRVVRLRRKNAEELRAQYEATKRPSLATLRRLLATFKPFDVDYRAPDTLLHLVVADDRLSTTSTLRCVKELVEKHRANPSLANDKQFTPLMSAAALGQASVASYLIPRVDLDAKGSHPNGFVGAPARPGPMPRTASQWAELYGHSNVVDLLDATKFASRKTKRRLDENDGVRYCVQDCKFDGRNTGEMVCCDNCEAWLHCACVGLPLSNFKALVRDSNARYLCPSCTPSSYLASGQN
ncbi:hypothetical protein CTAYLR_003978 [Chrysophaeum taylorii]|uniref:PHD-type domain-containing protein n=1 Tax=Chrysophaeum taylorii TaxID=2483200 RepID=A0AAD7UDW1_9STRA|nr:hypothetical protein CTAYLR_003978 [Chrysophaeum taylorii]